MGPLIYSTLFGGMDYDEPFSIDVDSQGNTYITGSTETTDFPITPNALMNVHDNITKAFLTKLNDNGTTLLYSTYLGGDESTIGLSITMDTKDNIYILGATIASDFPTTQGTLYESPIGGVDMFISKIGTKITQKEGIPGFIIPHLILISLVSFVAFVLYFKKKINIYS